MVVARRVAGAAAIPGHGLAGRGLRHPHRGFAVDGGLAWLLAGAAVYSAGTVFYANSRRWPHAHGIWHLFVMGGTACHFVTVFGFLRQGVV